MDPDMTLQSQGIPPLPTVAGHSLDGGTYTISIEENLRLCRSLDVAPDGVERAHPSFLYIATQVGMGESVAGLCKLCDFDVNDGPMLGSCDMQIYEPLGTGIAYSIRGEIVGVTRKASGKLGIMDILEYSLHMHHADGTRAATITNTWILPRGHSHDT